MKASPDFAQLEVAHLNIIISSLRVRLKLLLDSQASDAEVIERKSSAHWVAAYGSASHARIMRTISDRLEERGYKIRMLSEALIILDGEVGVTHTRIDPLTALATAMLGRDA